MPRICHRIYSIPKFPNTRNYMIKCVFFVYIAIELILYFRLNSIHVFCVSFPSLHSFLCLPLNLRIIQALIPDIQCAHCVRSVHVYLVYLFIVCHWYIRFAVIETGLVCAFYFFPSCRYWSDWNVFFFNRIMLKLRAYLHSKLQTHVIIHIHFVWILHIIHIHSCEFFGVIFCGFQIRGSTFFFFITRSLIYANWIRRLNDKLHRYVPYYYDSNLKLRLV